MKIEDQVCTLDQAKRLNDLGVVQGASAFYHNTNSGEIEHNSHHKTGTFYHAKYCFSAFTVAELGVMLKGRTMPIWWDLWEGFCYKEGSQPRGYGTEAQARAAMLLYLLENKCITAEEVNKRLEA